MESASRDSGAVKLHVTTGYFLAQPDRVTSYLYGVHHLHENRPSDTPIGSRQLEREAGIQATITR